MSRGPLAIYRFPVAGHDYTIGADPSSGVEPTSQSDTDPACVQVFDRDTGEFVAVWHGYMNPVPFAHLIAALGRMYNDAVAAPECNNGHGFAVLEELKAIGYHRLYQWSRVDKVSGRITDFLGWWTTYQTRPLLIDTFAFAINDREIVILDPPTIRECMEFQWIEGRAAGIKHDDRCIAAMIAYRVHLSTPLLSTGIPPRVRFGEGPKPEPEILPVRGTMMASINLEAWRSADEDQKNMVGKNPMRDYVPTEYEDEPQAGLDFIPELPF